MARGLGCGRGFAALSWRGPGVPRRRGRTRRPFLLSLACVLCPLALLASGCFGVSQNPSYFPWLLPTEDIIRTHAKPPGGGYYANFDPHAVRLEVRPMVTTNPVRTQQVLVATVYDEKGRPRRNRRVEWMVEGVGNIVEVDESGCFPGRGYKVDNHYAVSYTNYKEHRITRGNVNPGDDFVIRPGQSWCVITSAVEGDTHVTVYAPGIADWDRHKVFVTTHWVDAEWVFPAPATERSGAQHVFTTQVFRHTDRQPLANYRVRYRILDGPPAVFLPSHTQETVAVSNLRGHANVTVAQVQPALGVNRIGIEVIRPPDPTAPSGAGITIATGETAVEWLAPAVNVAVSGPASAAVNQDVPYTITVTNTGRIESRSLTLHDQVPPGIAYVSSQPPAIQEDRNLTWTLGMLPAGQAHTVQLVLRAPAPGTVVNCANVVTEEGLRAQNCATTTITAPALRVAVTGPPAAVVGSPVVAQITVANPGTGPAANVVLSAAFDVALEHETRANPVELRLGTLGPNESRTVPLTLTPRQVGRADIRVTATADGALRDQAQHTLTVQQAQLALTKKGATRKIVGRPADWDITVVNPGDVTLANVIIRDALPPELSFVSATEGGQVVDGSVEWRLGNLEPRGQRVVRVTARCERIAREVVNVAVATADPGLRVEARAPLEILGIPAYQFQLTPTAGMVEVGRRNTYNITVTNTGSLPGNRVRVTATVPVELKVISARGPSQETVQGNTVTFAPVDGLEPNRVLTYSIEVEALKPGDVRFRAALEAETLQPPVIKEASTTIYDPNAAAPAPRGARRPRPGPDPGPWWQPPAGLMRATSALAHVGDGRREPFNLVGRHRDRAGPGADADADPVHRPARLAQVVGGQGDRLGFALHVDADALVRPAVHDAVALQPVAVRRERLAALRPEQHADLAAAQDRVLPDEVVGVAVADGNARRAAVLDQVLLRQAVPDAPAKEEADGVALQPVGPDDRPLRPGAGVQAEPGVVVAVAVLDPHVVADLPADAVAVVVAGRHAAQGDPPAVLQEHAAGVVAVEVGVVLLVAVQGDVLDGDVGDVLAAQDREQGRSGGVALEPEVLPQGPVELEALAGAGDQGALDDGTAAGVRVARPQADAVAHLEAVGVGEGDFLVVPVGVGRQPGGPRGLLDQHRVGPAAEDADVRPQENGVAQAVGPRQDADGPAPQPGHVIDRGLEHLVGAADQIRLRGADRDGEAFLPVGLDAVAGSGPRVGDRRPFAGPGAAPAGGHHRQAGGRRQKLSSRPRPLLGWCHRVLPG